MKDITIVTHDGLFHADDVLAVAILKILFPSATVTRTREAAIITTADIVVDVGASYSPHGGRFDHHQRGGAGWRKNGIPFASAGLVWKNFGEDAIRRVIEGTFDTILPSEVDAMLTPIAELVDTLLVAGVDASDNGVPGPKGYCTLTNIVQSINPIWMDTLEMSTEEVKETFNRKFLVAVERVTDILLDKITQLTGELQAKNYILNAPEYDGILVLSTFVPWVPTVVQKMPGVQFVLFPSSNGDGWMAQAVPVKLGDKTNRKDLPQTWAGLEKEELRKVSGVATAIFCHNGRFIAAAETQEDAFSMARYAITQ